MAQDDIVPPSPPVKPNKSRTRSKNSDKSRAKKKPRSILSLRTKNLLERTKSDVASSFQSVACESSPNNNCTEPINVNIYDGIDDESPEEKKKTFAMVSNVDIFAQPKLMEQCNVLDMEETGLSQCKQTFSQSVGLISAQALLSRHSTSDIVTSKVLDHIDIIPNSPCISYSGNRQIDEAKEVSLENLQFSEWPIADHKNDNLNQDQNFDARHLNSPKTDQVDRLPDQHKMHDSNVSSIIRNILDDFTVEYESDEITKSPPLVFVRRANKKTFTRTQVATSKKLLPDKNTSDDEQNDCDSESSQDIDIDLNSSRRIVENLTRLNSFFTQPQSYELDFNADLTLTTLDEEFREFDHDANESHFALMPDLVPTDHDDASIDQSKDDLNEMELENDLFMNFTTPKIECRGVKKSKLNISPSSTPLSVAKGTFEDTSHSTPTISKQTIPSEQRVPKRLRFGPDTEQQENVIPVINELKCGASLPGFATARGCSIKMSANQMKRTATIFADIDDKYGNIDPMLEESHDAKKVKISMEQSDISKLEKSAQGLVGFKKAGGGNCTVTSKLTNFFGEDFSDLGQNNQLPVFGLSTGPNISCTAGTGKGSVGFSTARGSSINISDQNKRKSAQMFQEIDQSIRKEYASDLSQTNTSCAAGPSKAPIGFSTARGSSINISDKNKQKSAQMFQEIDQSIRKEYASDLSQTSNQLPSFGQPTSLNTSCREGPSKTSVGFSTARGSSINISDQNKRKSAQMFQEIDQDIRKKYESKHDASVEGFNMVCKTPLSKSSHHVQSFATSTPIPNANNVHKYPPVTPIMTPIANDNMDDSDSEWFEVLMECSTQPQNTSINLNEVKVSEVVSSNESIIDVLHIEEDVKRERMKTLSEQQAASKQNPVVPLVGTLLVQKLLNSKKLHELGVPQKYTRSELERFGVKSNVIDVSVDNALQFQFDMWHFYSEHDCRTNIHGLYLQDSMRLILDGNSRVGIMEITSAFLQCPTVDPKLVPDRWIDNCLKWIIFKLASYERSYPRQFAGKSLTPENVLAQMKYRYDCEIDKVKRSAIRKIVEQDDTAAKRMILFVSRIVKNDLSYSLELCDGWYAIRSCELDVVLSRAVTNGKIDVGTKLVIQGAELTGIEAACGPLEMPSSAVLKISANSTRRARWFARLGFCNLSSPFAISLNSICENGGIITRTRAYVARVYPLVFAVKEKTEDGHKTVFRSNKVEQRQSKKYDKKRFEIVEKLYAEASEMVEKEYRADKKRRHRTKKKICDIEDGEELWNYMDNSNDNFDLDLTVTQRKLLEDYSSRMNDAKQSRIDAIVREKLADEAQTKSTALQKVRLVDAAAPNATKTVILSIWNANESQNIVRENTILDLQKVNANGMRGKDMLLSAGSYTIIREVHSNPLDAYAPFKRKLTSLCEIDAQLFNPIFNEFDTLGFVLSIEETPQKFQTVYIVDDMQNVLCIKFWGSMQQYAYDDIVEINKFLVINHLEWRTQNRFNQNGVPQAFVNELTTFSESPRCAERASVLASLRERFDNMNLDEYIAVCREKLDTKTQGNKENSTSNVSHRANDTSLNRTYMTSPVVQNKTPIQRKVDLLRNYSSPPPFRSAYIGPSQTPTGARKQFKSPCVAFAQKTNNK